MDGRKFDQNKPRWGLLPLKPMREIVKVLTFGADKYEEDNWKRVPHAKSRYYDAMLRHITDWKDGEILDPESGYHHLAHAGCCLLFILYFEITGTPDTPINDNKKVLLNESESKDNRDTEELRDNQPQHLHPSRKSA